MANIFVTGGTGLIGSRITEHLLRSGHAVATFDLVPNPQNLDTSLGGLSLLEGNICDLTGLSKAIADHGSDYVVHMAAVVSDAADANPRLTMDVNVGGVSNVLAAAREQGVRRTVWASSAAALGSRPGDKGTSVPDDHDVRPATLYGASKLAAEIVSAHARRDGVDCIGIRPALIYGLGRLSGGAGAFNSAVRDVALGRPAVLNTLDGLQMQLMYNKDFARLIEAMLFAPRQDLLPVYNMPCRKPVSAEGMAEVLTKLCPDAQIEIRSSPAWQPVPPLMDGSRAEQDFGFSPSYSLEAAFAEMIALFQAGEASGAS